jgi:hypothetical protein
VHVSGSLELEGGHLRLGDAKTPRSRRPLGLPRPVVVALRAHRKRRLEEQMAPRKAWLNDGLVSCSEVGTPIDPSNLRRTTKALTEKAKVPTSPQRARSPLGSLIALRGGRAPGRHCRILGHASTRMVEQTHRHRLTESMTAHVAPMEKLFGNG